MAEDNHFPAVVEGRIGDDLVQTVNAREIHAFLGVKSEFRNWMKNRIDDFGFVENADFVTVGKNLPGGGRQVDYHVSIDMAKELGMVDRSDKGREVRQYFLECERKAKAGGLQPAPTTAEMLLQSAQVMVEVERKQAALEVAQVEQAHRIATTERRLDQIETATDHFTCVGYARWAKQMSIDLKDAADLGRRASKRCRELGIPISKIPDPRFGVVNQFPKAILDEV